MSIIPESYLFTDVYSLQLSLVEHDVPEEQVNDEKLVVYFQTGRLKTKEDFDKAEQDFINKSENLKQIILELIEES